MKYTKIAIAWAIWMFFWLTGWVIDNGKTDWIVYVVMVSQAAQLIYLIFFFPAKGPKP